MFHFLLLAFLLDPSSGTIQQVRAPFNTEEQCVDAATVLSSKAKAAGVGILGTCIPLSAFEGDT